MERAGAPVQRADDLALCLVDDLPPGGSAIGFHPQRDREEAAATRGRDPTGERPDSRDPVRDGSASITSTRRCRDAALGYRDARRRERGDRDEAKDPCSVLGASSPPSRQLLDTSPRRDEFPRSGGRFVTGGRLCGALREPVVVEAASCAPRRRGPDQSRGVRCAEARDGIPTLRGRVAGDAGILLVVVRRRPRSRCARRRSSPPAYFAGCEASLYSAGLIRPRPVWPYFALFNWSAIATRPAHCGQLSEVPPMSYQPV